MGTERNAIMTTIDMVGGQGVKAHALTTVGAGARPPASIDGSLLEVLAVCEQHRLRFEERQGGLGAVVELMTRSVAQERVTSGIDSYRTVIRRNDWLYPTVVGPIGEVSTFLHVWSDVHTEYFTLATEIFELLTSEGASSLLDPALYARVIASETSRGWVGKRSPIGPDCQIEHREALIESVLADHIDDTDIDTLLTLGGLLPATRVFRSAEQDMTALLSTLVLNVDSTEHVAEARARMLRDYTKYSVRDLEDKVAAFTLPRGSVPAVGATSTLDDLLDRLPHRTRGAVVALLADIRVLNFLNLNLEPRFSFKSWAGLMHGLVFEAVRDLPGMSDDIYRNLYNLKESK
jgi:hypothetical protein